MAATVLILFSIASLVALATRRSTIPYTVALVVVGFVIGQLHLVEPPRLTHELLFGIFLPGLVFEAAFNIHLHHLRASWRTVTALAVPGVIVGMLLVAPILVYGFRLVAPGDALGWSTALVFAAIVSATDPIAVVALFRRLGVPDRLTTIVDAESLFNDGTAIVVVSLVIGLISGTQGGAPSLILQFVWIIVGGAAIGLALAFVMARISRALEEPVLEIHLTVLAAYGSFLLAEWLHLSGVIATVAAGILIGSYGRAVSMSEPTRRSVDAFWQYIAFALNSVVFLLIGFNVGRPTAASLAAILIGFIAVVIARFGMVYLVAAATSKSSERLERGWATVTAWGGLRGALSMVLALALPEDFPSRALIIDLTFGVALLSIVVQGTSMQLLVRHLALAKEH